MLALHIRGKVIVPGDPAYEEERKVWNATVNKYPAGIVHCLNAEDVKNAITFARDHGMELSIRSGGHSVSGYSVSENGLVIDLSEMKSIIVDPVQQTARIEPGLTWGDVAKALHPYGLALTSGDTATVGVGGLLLGGGIGWMVRKYGLSIDRVRAIELVTAEGRLVRASTTENAELFWGLRGGGGNFGVVTAFEVDLHAGGTILGGMIIFEASDAERILQEYARLAWQAPEELTTSALLIEAPAAPFIPAEKQGKPAVGIMVCYTGAIDEGENIVAPFRELATPIVDLIVPMPYPQIFVFNEVAEIRGLQHVANTLFFDTIDQEMITTLVKAGREVMSPETLIQFRVLGGAMGRVANDATAFVHRDKQAMILITHFAAETYDLTDLANRTQLVFQALSRYGNGAYVGFQPDNDDQGVYRAYPAATYARLAALKRQYDPENIFHLNANIKPEGYEKRECITRMC